MNPVIVTIDGPAGVGKSTLAGRMAEALHMAYLDTGAMFRTIALQFAESKSYKGTPGSWSESELDAALRSFSFSLQGTGADTRLLCNGQPVGDAIRSEKAGMMAADIAVLPLVRQYLKEAQQAVGKRYNLVTEGRDMGTAVFPEAACKIFLDATVEIRAQRRFHQLQELNSPADLGDLVKQIAERDKQDRNRPIAPLRPAEDAVTIDTSYLGIDEVFSAMMEAARTKLPERFF